MLKSPWMTWNDARLVCTDRPMGVVLVSVPEEKRWNFYRHGAMLVSGTGLPAACIGRIKV